jgi:hypothetical protein
MKKTYTLLASSLALLTAQACGEGTGDGTEPQTVASASGTPVTSAEKTASSAPSAAASSSAAASASAKPGGVTVLYSFDVNTEEFALQDYKPGDPMYSNLYYQCGDNAKDEGEPLVDCSKLKLTQAAEAAAGGTAGGLKLEVPYFGYNQSVELQVNPKTPKDITGKILKVKVLADMAGFTPDAKAPGGGYLFVKSKPDADWLYYSGDWRNFEQKDRGMWMEFTLDGDAPAGGDDITKYDPTVIYAIGIQISTGGGTAESEAPSAAKIYIDQITTEDK